MDITKKKWTETRLKHKKVFKFRLAFGHAVSFFDGQTSF